MKFSLKTLIIGMLFCPAVLWGQSDSLFFSVRGVVRDASTGRILPEVGVSVSGTNYATVTNSEGTFIIKSNAPVQSLTFTLMGYGTIVQEPPAGPGALMSVRMKSRNYTLDPSLVVSGDPAELMRIAIARISANYPSEPELYDCFYRETVQKRQRFIYVSEAVTKMYKSAYSGYSGSDRAALVKSRLLTSPKASDTLAVKVIGGPSMPVALDLVKNRSVVLDNQDLDYYNLDLLPPQAIDSRMQFVIRLTPAISGDFAMQNALVYIDRETMAFTRLELSLDMSDPEKATRAMLVRRPSGLRFKPREMSLQLNYKPEGGVYRLSYLKTVFRFGCDWRRRLFATDYNVVAEAVVTNRHSGSDVVKIPRKEALVGRESLSDISVRFIDPDFWKDYNIIEPTVGLEHAVGRLKVK